MTGPASRRVLRGALAKLLEDARVLGTCRLRGAKFRPGRELRAYFDVRLDAPGRRGVARQVAVTWKPAKRFSGLEGAEEPEAEALGRGWAAPFRGLHAERASWGMRLLIAPLDPPFPELGHLLDPRSAGEVINGDVARSTATLVRYIPGRRHLLRYDPAPGDPSGRPLFLKLYADDTPHRLLAVMETAAEWLASSNMPHTLVTPAPVPPHPSALVYPRAEGAPLSSLLSGRGSKGAETLRETGELLRTLQQVPVGRLAGLKVHELSDQLLVIARAGEHIGPLCATAGHALEWVLGRAEEINASLSQEPHALVHGDFKADHVFVEGSRLSLLDFDNCRLADPALDAGKMLADLQWGHAMRGWSGLEEAQAAFLEGYLKSTDPMRLARARLWEALFIAKAAARRPPLFDREWKVVTEKLLARAEAALRRIRRQRPPDALPAAQLVRALERNKVYLLSRIDPSIVEDLDMIHVAAPEELARLARQHRSCIVLANAPHVAVKS